ncbi:MAG: amidohydrolase [Balneolales bacterium]
MEEPLSSIKKLRHELHSLAEVSNKEKTTAEFVRDFLKRTNPDSLIEDIGGHGLAAVYEGKETGPTVMIRSELDALPIPETINLEYKSITDGIAHKCGHDGHMAIVCGIAEKLYEHPQKKGRVVLLFQPAEETGEGAAQILDDARFKTIAPDYVFALHNLPGYAEGEIVVKDGVFASASRGLIIKLKGKTSHAGHPEDGISPALAAASLIQGLTALPVLHTALHNAAMVTIIHARVGEIAFGTTPGYAEVMATLRAYQKDDMEILIKKALELTEGISMANNLKYETAWTEIFEANINDKKCVQMIKAAAAANGIKSRVIKNPFPWSEDFGRFTQEYPGAIFGIGAGSEHPQLHNSNYDFPDSILPTGITMFNSIIRGILG